MKVSFIFRENDPKNNVLFDSMKYFSKVQLNELKYTPLLAIDSLLKFKSDYYFFQNKNSSSDSIGFTHFLNCPISIMTCDLYAGVDMLAFFEIIKAYGIEPLGHEEFVTQINAELTLLKNVDPSANLYGINKDYMFVTTERKGRKVKVEFKNLTHIEGMNNKVAFHTDSDIVISKFSLAQLQGILPRSSFVRVSKSYIINIDKIVSFDKNGIRLNRISTTHLN